MYFDNRVLTYERTLTLELRMPNLHGLICITTFEWRKFANRTVQTPATRSHVVCGFACGKAKSTCVIYLPDGEILGNLQMVKFWNKN